MSINQLTSLMAQMVPSTSGSKAVAKSESSFKAVMNSKDDRAIKDKVAVKEKDNKKTVEDVLEDINEAMEKLEDGSKEEIIEEIMVLLQMLNLPLEDNTKLPIIIDLEASNLLEDVTSEVNGESLQSLDIDELISDEKIEKLLSYLSDKDGNAIKKEKFIELINISTKANDEDTTAGVEMVKMVFSMDNNIVKEKPEDDILAKLLSLEDDELSKVSGNDEEAYIAEDNAMFVELLNSKKSTESTINESKPVNISKETVSTDMVTNIKYMMKNEIQQLTVKIYPKELGEITIKLLSEDGIMKANIKSTSKETYLLLNSNMEEIKRYLSSENISIKEVNIELYNEDTTYYSGQEFESQFQEEKEQGSYVVEDSKLINTKEDKEEEIVKEVSNVNLLA